MSDLLRAGAGALLGLLLAGCGGRPPEPPRFEPRPLELTTYSLFDLGVADVDEDGVLDLYTSNHNGRSGVFLGDGRGGFGDNRLSALGLDQDPEFPGLDDDRSKPPELDPGLSIYWQLGRLVLLARGLDRMGPVAGRITLSSAVRVQAEGLEFEKTEVALASDLARTTLEFRTPPGVQQGRLALRPAFVAVPVTFALEPGVQLEQVAVGAQGVRPRSHRFVLALRDRHGLAWADFDGDGQQDVFITRGGLKGQMKRFPETFSDELLCRRDAVFADCLAGTGIEKNATRARAPSWVDYDGDGRLDLHVRGWASPDRLYHRLPDGTFVDVAPDLDLDEVWTGSSVWLDVDDDGDLDLLLQVHAALQLYERRDDGFEKHGLGPVEGPVGQLSISDYDRDGDLDLFRAGQENVLLVNQGGRLERVDPTSLGLPAASATGQFVDHDNDGLPDLHLVPGGIYRQQADGTFQATPLLADAAPEATEEAKLAWFDANNDGSMDVLVAYREPPRRGWKTGFWLSQGSGNHWLQVKLVGPPGNRPAIGARVRVESRLGTQLQQVGGAESAEFSQGHYRLYFGLGRHRTVDALRVAWPDGTSQELRKLQADRLHEIRHPRAVEPARAAAKPAR